MGAWTKNKTDSSKINGGQEYTKNSNVALDQLNLITNNSFYAVDKADEALTKANSAFENNGTVVSVGGSTVPTLSFNSDPQTQINLKASQSDLDTANSKIISLTEDKANKDLSNVTVNIEKTELLYDMSSSDSSINWGYTSGVGTGTIISNKNFEKYKKLICYYKDETQKDACSSELFVDLTHINTTTNVYMASSVPNLARTTVLYGDCVRCYISPDKTRIEIYAQQYSTQTAYDNNNMKVYKIEGVY